MSGRYRNESEELFIFRSTNPKKYYKTCAEKDPNFYEKITKEYCTRSLSDYYSRRFCIVLNSIPIELMPKIEKLLIESELPTDGRFTLIQNLSKCYNAKNNNYIFSKEFLKYLFYNDKPYTFGFNHTDLVCYMDQHKMSMSEIINIRGFLTGSAILSIIEREEFLLLDPSEIENVLLYLGVSRIEHFSGTVKRKRYFMDPDRYSSIVLVCAKAAAKRIIIDMVEPGNVSSFVRSDIKLDEDFCTNFSLLMSLEDKDDYLPF